ncbi:PaaI family thioesterase [Ichthyobacterium seriolicida]|uniref:Thioesterase domain-containing protein n=1 Tax=Ichthyobacterium seriolicida TaxID=242600 RepID=A0A1J1DYF2_9FLAO|nr:PaaI family thioesterase [Ichthyobacterium seriolicida]BAV94930.1 hypothetical protein JBKA6_0917 [Ichthyobacterium seriolicida]
MNIKEQFQMVIDLGMKLPNLKIKNIDDNGNIDMLYVAKESDYRLGGYISGPVQMALADVSMYFTVLLKKGLVLDSSTVSLNCQFLEPAKVEQLRIRAHCNRAGNRLAFGNVDILSVDDDTIFSQSTVIFSIGKKVYDFDSLVEEYYKKQGINP